MKHLMSKFIVAITLLLIGASHINAQESILPVEERQAKLDSIIAETERHFGWNDDAYSAKIAKDKWQSGKAKLLLQGGIAPVIYIGQEKFAKKYGVDYDNSVVLQVVRTLKWQNIILPLWTVSQRNPAKDGEIPSVKMCRD